MKRLISILLVIITVALLLIIIAGVVSPAANTPELSSYTYDEYSMYSIITRGYIEILGALKNPNTANFLGIGYNPDTSIAFYCIIAENDFGGNTKSYISYNGINGAIHESDDLKLKYDSAEIHRSIDDLYAFMKAVENADESDIPTKSVNEALETYSKSDIEMYELVLSGIDELELFYEELVILGYKYSTASEDVYFHFMGDDAGDVVWAYASYSDGLGIMLSDAYKAQYENADVELSISGIMEYKEAIKKDISK